ncbi:MAG: DUF2203 domain-containing protein [Patescibacteria group bacterium]
MEKQFTLESANRALSLVRPIVSDILTKMRAAEVIHGEVKTEKARLSMSETTLLDKLKAAETLLNQVEYHMKELQSVGTLLKDLSLGLIDFPFEHEGRTIYLCWMPGEPEVKFWHEMYQGFSHRKSIDASFAGSLTAQ